MRHTEPYSDTDNAIRIRFTGSKKIQQALALPGALERFLPAPGAAAQLSAFFAGLWGLDDLQDPDTAAIVSQAIADPDSYVLKPQREGGGNNMYGACCLCLCKRPRTLPYTESQNLTLVAQSGHTQRCCWEQLA